MDPYLPRLGPRMGREYRNIYSEVAANRRVDPHPEMSNPDLRRGQAQPFGEFIKRAVEPLMTLSSVYVESIDKKNKIK